jgi:hypothetical protein
MMDYVSAILLYSSIGFALIELEIGYLPPTSFN